MAVLDKNGTEYLWNKAKEKFAAKDDVPKIPEGVVLYTEQALTDSQKAQARENIGAVGTVEATEEVYTYVFTGEEEVVNGVFVKLPEFITKEFLASPFDVVLSTPDGNISARDKFGEEVLVTAVASEDPYIAENGIFVTVIAPYDDFDMDGFVLSTGVWVGCTLGAAFHSITSTVPYTKTVQKIDKALLPNSIKPIYVEVTGGTGEDGKYVYSSNKTFAEIEELIDSGYTVALKVIDNDSGMYSIFTDMLMFAGVAVMFSGIDAFASDAGVLNHTTYSFMADGLSVVQNTLSVTATVTS